MSKRPARRFAWLCLFVLLVAQAAHAGPFNSLAILGDSLSDTGNAYESLGTLAQDPNDYYMGRFSNGPVWVEYLAQQLQLPTPVGNYLSSSGRNYAFGGAWTQAGLFNITHWVINDVNEQVSDLVSDTDLSDDDLVILWAGANDLLDGQTNTQANVNNLTGSIGNLYNDGGRRFMVVNLPLLGKTPRFVGTSQAATMNNLATSFNNNLDTALDSLQSSLAGIQFIRIDAASLISDAVDNPAAYGLTNVTTPALGLTGINADEYLFWDDIHPTTAAHRLLAENAVNVLFDALQTLDGDLDFDGFVGIDDLNIVLGSWNSIVSPGNPLLGDPTGDGFVGIEDLNQVLGNWNAGTPPTTSANVPEPGTVSVLALLLTGCLAPIRR